MRARLRPDRRKIIIMLKRRFLAALAASAAEFETYGAIDKMIEIRVEFARLQRNEGEPRAARRTLDSALEEVQRHEAAGDYDGAALRAVIAERLGDLESGGTASWDRL